MKHVKHTLYYCGIGLFLASVLISYVIAGVFQRQETFLSSFPLGDLTVLQFMTATLAMVAVWLASSDKRKVSDYKLLIVVAVFVRLILIPVESYTSSDMSRYLFDGYIAINGYDPYRVSHDAPYLQDAREQWNPPSEHAKYVTLYPPVALGLFSLAASGGAEYAVLIWKLMLAGASLATLWLSFAILKHAGRLPFFPLIALSPLLVLEAGVGGHLDAFSVLAVALVIWAWQRNYLGWCGAFIGVGALIKLLPAVLLVPIFFIVRGFFQKLLVAISAAGVVISGYAAAFAFGLQPIGSIGVFFQKWRFGSPVFSAIESVSGAAIIFVVCLLLLGMACIAYCSWRYRDDRLNGFSEVTLMQMAVALPLLLSPVVFPWYLMPLIPLLALRANAWLLVWVTFLPLTYEVLNQFHCCRMWQPADWPLWVVAVAIVVALIWDGLQKRLRQHQQYWLTFYEIAPNAVLRDKPGELDVCHCR